MKVLYGLGEREKMDSLKALFCVGITLGLAACSGGTTSAAGITSDAGVDAGIGSDAGVTETEATQGDGSKVNPSVFDDADIHSDAGVQADTGVSGDAQPKEGGEIDAGCTWQLISPKIGVKTLRALWGSVAEDVYAVGDSGTLLHYDGKTWTKVKLDTIGDLFDIWGSDKNNIYVVGEDKTADGLSSKNAALFFHFDGHDWTEITKLPAFPYIPRLNAVWGRGPEDVFVAGSGQLSNPSILHFDGSTWRGLAPRIGSLDWSDVFGCGPNDTYAIEGNRLYRFDGTNWLPFETPIPASSLLNTVWCSSANDIWLFGNFDDSSSGAMHWNGKTWSDLKTEAPETAAYEVTNTFETPDGTRFLIGRKGALLRLDGGVWRPIATQTQEDIHAIWGAGSEELFLAGERGVLLKVTPAGVQNFNQGTESALTELLNLGKEGFAAVDERGTLLLGDAQQILVESYTNPSNFIARSALGTRSDDILLGGENCEFDGNRGCTGYPSPLFASPALVRYDGTKFRTVELGVLTRRLVDFEASGSGAPVFVDIRGKVGLFQNGALVDFAQQPPVPALYVTKNAAGDLYALSSLDRHSVFTPSPPPYVNFTNPNSVSLYRYQNSAWTEVASVEMYDDPIDILFGDDANLYLFGRYGTVYRYTGSAFQLVADKLPADLQSSGESRYRSTPSEYTGVVKAVNDIYIAPGLFHYDGSQWRLVDINGTEAAGDVSSIFKLDSGDLYAILTSPGSPIVSYDLMRYDGSSWSTVSLPDGFAMPPSVIWGPTTQDFYLGDRKGQIWHSYRNSWSSGPKLANREVTFTGEGNADAWVANSFGDVVHQVQGDWRTEREAMHCNAIVDFLHIDNDTYAVCQNGDVLRQQGAQWQSLGPLSPCTDALGSEMGASGIWGDSQSNLFLFGRYIFVMGSAGFICHYDGKVWEGIPYPPGSNDGYAVKTVWGRKDDLYALSVDVTFAIEISSNTYTHQYCEAAIQHYDGTAWSIKTCEEKVENVSNASDWITSGPGTGRLIVTGDNYTGQNMNNAALYYNGARWTSFPLPDTKIAWCVGDPATELYAASSEGAIYHKKCQ